MSVTGDHAAAAKSELSVRRPARTDDVTLMRYSLTGWLRAHSLTGDLAHDVELATYEALINTASHAYPAGIGGTVELNARHQDDLIRITVTDDGRWQPPTRDPGQRGGRGLTIMRALADLTILAPTDVGTTVTMTWYLTLPETLGTS
ncbi:ATP-binding protein [Amycolatopsis sp. NPDC005232]|uniref:ATP-binding protein n=1 Tax=Amycolatopsis sp. NPDC005232 TaxID=3157027 RepID=UPI0033ABCF7D